MAEEELLAIRALSNFKQEFEAKLGTYPNIGLGALKELEGLLNDVYHDHIRRLTNVVPKIEIKTEFDLTKAENKVAKIVGTKKTFTEPI